MGDIQLLRIQMNADSLDSFPEQYRPIIEGRPCMGTSAFAIAVFGWLDWAAFCFLLTRSRLRSMCLSCLSLV